MLHLQPCSFGVFERHASLDEPFKRRPMEGGKVVKRGLAVKSSALVQLAGPSLQTISLCIRPGEGQKNRTGTRLADHRNAAPLPLEPSRTKHDPAGGHRECMEQWSGEFFAFNVHQK